VATFWVRYADGDEAEWHLTDALAADLNTFTTRAMHAGYERNLFSFPVATDEGAPGIDYGYVSLRMENVVAWRVEGLVNEAAAAALWAEVQGPEPGG
jgi:hypothetical protein